MQNAHPINLQLHAFLTVVRFMLFPDTGFKRLWQLCLVMLLVASVSALWSQSTLMIRFVVAYAIFLVHLTLPFFTEILRKKTMYMLPSFADLSRLTWFIIGCLYGMLWVILVVTDQGNYGSSALSFGLFGIVIYLVCFGVSFFLNSFILPIIMLPLLYMVGSHFGFNLFTVKLPTTSLGVMFIGLSIFFWQQWPSFAQKRKNDLLIALFSWPLALSNSIPERNAKLAESLLFLGRSSIGKRILSIVAVSLLGIFPLLAWHDHQYAAQFTLASLLLIASSHFTSTSSSLLSQMRSAWLYMPFDRSHTFVWLERLALRELALICILFAPFYFWALPWRLAFLSLLTLAVALYFLQLMQWRYFGKPAEVGFSLATWAGLPLMTLLLPWFAEKLAFGLLPLFCFLLLFYSFKVRPNIKDHFVKRDWSKAHSFLTAYLVSE